MKALTTYQSLCTEFYDLEFAERHKKGIEHLEQMAFFMEQAKQAGGTILEPMCGSGRILLPLFNAGYDIEGFDASPYMLAALFKKQAQINNKKPVVCQAFIQQFTSTRLYNLIIIPFGSLGLITNQEELAISLNNIYKLLAPNGTFIFEIDTVHSIPQQLGVQHRGSHKRPDEKIIELITQESYNPVTQIFTAASVYQLKKDNLIEYEEQELFIQYIFNEPEMDNLLKKAGFLIKNKFSSYKKTPLNNKKNAVIIYECSK